ncbi:ribonuclease Y [Spiroplasma endosymbiont of Labia minor]|uniref:ribonuclease Y n=1 Tax=Spiroplasma endosymbiont of Labia minor TaxID=3066305 RepID=UPI0030CC759A
MTTNIFVGILVALVLCCVVLAAYILYSHFSQRRQRLIKNANDEVKRIILRGVADAKVESEHFRVNQEMEVIRQKKEWEKNNEELFMRSEVIRTQQEELFYKEEKLLNRNKLLEFEREKYQKKFDELLDYQSEMVNLPIQEVRDDLKKSIEQKYQLEMNSIIKNIENQTNLKAKEVATNIILAAMNKYKTDIVVEKTVSYVHLENDDVKGRVIGKEGRNIKAFEQYGGVDVIIDDTPNIITISSFSPIRREIAKKALETLIEDGRIQPIRIEEELIHQELILDTTIFEQGKTVIEELGITDMDFELIKMIGKLKYRTSYGQPVLNHVIEVAKIASTIAGELGLDRQLATRAGLLHDVGKATDFEIEGTHVSIGVEAARKAGESSIVVNAIAAHHGEVAKESIYAEIVIIADSLSAARPGARNNLAEAFFVRMSEIERIIKEIDGVLNVYVLQSGRQIRVIVNPYIISDEDIISLPPTIEKIIRENVVVPGDITITVIREMRTAYTAKQATVRY